MTTTKLCIKCNEETNIANFYLNKGRPSSYCKECICANTKVWRNNNRERERVSQNIRKGNRIVKGQCRHCSCLIMPTHKTLCERHYIAKKADFAVGSCSAEIIDKLKTKLEQQNFECPYTGEKLILGINDQLDHIYPKIRFAELKEEIDNIQWISKRANLSKSDLTHEEFIELCNLVSSRFS